MTELTPINIWSAENNITDPIEQRRGYKNYVIGEYFANDELDRETSELINENFASSLKDVGASDEVINAELEDKGTPFEVKLASVYDYTDPASEDRSILREYNAAREMMAAGTLTEASQQAYAERMPILEEQVKAIVDSNFDKAQLAKVADGSIPFAKIKRGDGDYTFVGGDLASNLTPVEAYKQSLRAGTISPDDALAIKKSYEIPDGESVPYFKYINYQDSVAAAETLVKEDKDVSKWMGMLAQSIGKQDQGGDAMRKPEGELLENIDQIIGGEGDVRRNPVAKQAAKTALRPTDEQLYGLIIDKMSSVLPDSKFIPTSDKQAAVEYLAGSFAAQNGLLKFRAGEEAGQNLHYFGYKTPVIHREALTNKANFESMLASTGLTDKQKDQMTKNRDSAIQSMFNEYNQVFKDTYLADDWNRALQKGYSEDKKDGEILDEFLQTADYSGIQNRVSAIGSSVVDSFVDMGAAVGTLFKSDAAREVLLTNQRERDSRRRLANMFGDKFGVAMTLGEMAAPVVLDVATTAVLTGTTGVGGAAYAGAKLSARGVVLGITRGALAVGAKETAEAAAKRLVTSGVIKGATKEAAISSAETAIKSYAATTANKYVIRSAAFIPAATRSGGNTYASVYSALDNSPEGKNLTKDEKHSRALAAGLVAGAVTGGITLGFSMIGRGGLEDFILGGATPRQLKAVLTKIRGREFGEGVEFDKVVTAYAKNGLKSMWKNSAGADVAKNFTDEALEEATDELVNGYIQSAATGQDVPILERLQQSAMAGFYGGVFGGGMRAFQRTAGQFARGGAIEAESREATLNLVANDLATKLKDAGSPLAAEVILNRLKNPLQKAAATAPTPAAVTTPAADTTPAAADINIDEEIKDIDLPEIPVQDAAAPEVPLLDTAIPEEPALDVVAPEAVDTELDVEGDSMEEIQADLDNASVSDIQEAIDEVLSESSPEAPALVFTYTTPEVEQSVIEDSTEEDLGELEVSTSDIEALYAAGEQQGLTKEQIEKNLALISPIEEEEEVTDRPADSAREIEEAKAKAASIAEAAEAAKAAAIAAKAAAAAAKATKAAELKAEAAAKAVQLADSKAKKAAEKTAAAEAKAAEKAAAAEAKAAEKAAAAEAKAATKKAASERKTGKEAAAADPLQASQIKAIKKAIGSNIETIASHGFPIRLTKGSAYGMPNGYQNVKNPSEISDIISKRIYEKFPVLSVVEVAKYSGILNPEPRSTPQANEFDPVSGKFVERNIQTYYVATDGGTVIGLFDNNPRSMVEMLRNKIPVRVPESFPELTRNKSIRFDEVTRLVNAVRGPTAADPNVLENKDKRKSRSAAPEVSKTADDSFELLDGLKPIGYSSMEINRDLLNITDTTPLDNTQTTFAEASIKVSTLISSIYVSLTGGSQPSDYSKKEDKTAKRQATDTAAAMFTMMGIKRANLKGARLAMAKETAAMELVPEFEKALIFGELFQSLQKSGAIEMKDGRYAIKADAEQDARNALLARIKVPADFTSAKTSLPIAEEVDQKAAFIYAFGFKKGQNKPILKEGEKNKTKKLTSDWGNRVLDSYIDGVINDAIARPDAKYGLFPNIKAIASRVGTRALKRVEYADQEKATEDVYSLDSDNLSEVTTIGTAEDPQEVSDISETYSTDDSIIPYIFTKEAARKASSETSRSFLKPAFELIDFDVEVQQALRMLAKDTVHRESPSLAETLKPKELFRAIAKWAVSKSFSQTESYRFRRQFLDRFPATSETTATISQAFETYGAYNYDFKKVTDKKQRDAFIRLGFSELETTLLTQKSVPTLLAAKLGITEAEAKSLHNRLAKNIHRFDAPSFINSKHRKFFRSKNNKEIKRLNLESGNPNSVVAAMNEIMKSSKNKQHRKVAQFLLKNPDLITKTRFTIASIDNNTAGQFSVGSDGVGHVVINMTGFYGSGVESVLLHEYLHAATVDLTTKPESELSDSQRMAKKRLNGLLEISRRAYDKQLANGGRTSLLFESGTQNIEEFISTFFTSSDFQNTLKVTRDVDSRRNFFTRILDAIKDLFGVRLNKAFDSAFSDLIDFTTIGNIDPASTSIEARMDQAVSDTINEGRKFSPIPKLDGTATEIDLAQFASFEALTDGELGTPEQQRMIDYLIDQAVQSQIPADVAVSVFDTQQDADDSGAFGNRPKSAIVATIIRNADGTEQSAIFINRANMRNALLSRSSVVKDANMAKGLLETLINEELTHVAEFNAVPTKMIDAMIDETLDQEFDNIIDDYTADPALRASLKAGIRGTDAAEAKRQMIGEHLRMYHQRVARGFTTEEDINFLESSPSLMQIAFRYIRGVFRRTYARYNLNKNNPELAAVIHLMSNELHYLRAGSFTVNTNSAFDPRSPAAGFEVIRRQFAATSVDITDETTDEEINTRFDSFINSIDLPISQYVKGNYKGFSGIISWFKGNLDPRVTRLKKQQQYFENASEAIAKSYMSKLSRLIDATNGGVEASDLSDAAGSTEMISVDKETKLRLSQAYLSALKERRRRVKEGTLDPKYISPEAQSEMRKRMVKDRFEAYRDAARENIRRRQDAALTRIREDYPELAATISEFRSVIDGLSRKLKDTYNLSEKMQLKFDSNMGIYLTRAYRAFNEEGYIDKVLTSPDGAFVEIRDKVTPYFRERYVDKLASALKKQSKIEAAKDKTKTKKELTKEEAKQKAEDQVNDDPTAIANFMSQFLRSYEKDYRKRRPLEGGVTKSLIENLKNKSNLDLPVRQLLGEYDKSEDAIDNMFRTFAVVTSMASRQSFYNNLISVGSMVEQTKEDGTKEMVGFLMTREELNEKMRNDPAFVANDFVNLRTGRTFVGDAEDTIPKDLAGEYDPTYHYYGPKELIDGMRNAYEPKLADENMTDARRAIDNLQVVATKLTGLALGAKTLFSVGFYLRNIISNMVFFGPSQGFVNMFAMGKELGLVGRLLALKDPTAINDLQAELVTLGVLNNEMQTGFLKDVLSGKLSINKMEGEMVDILDKLKTVKDKASKTVAPFMDRLQALSGAVDGFYKIAYFKNELATLERAKQADIEAGNDSYYSRLSEYEMKREAARKVLATAQSYSEAPPVVQEFVRGPGVLVSPFLRFKFEVPRIVWNTYKESVAEMKSGNSVMAARGAKRIAGMTTVLTLFSAGVAEIMKGILDMGDEEEEARRNLLPSFMQDNSLIYYEVGGDLKSMDLTFINPFALLVDPILRGVEKASQGDMSGAASASLSALFSTYLDMQILSGAAMDVIYNKDSTTGQEIRNSSDGLNNFGKGVLYVLDKSYNPRILEKGIDAYKASQAPVVDEQYSASSILLGEFKAARPYTIDSMADYEKLASRAASEHRKAKAQLNILRSKRPISDDDIRELYRDVRDRRLEIDQGVFKGTRGFINSKNGIRVEDAARIMKGEKYGPRKINLLLNGYTERQSISKEFAAEVIKGIGQEQGLRRLNVLYDEINKDVQYMKLDTK